MIEKIETIYRYIKEKFMAEERRVISNEEFLNHKNLLESLEVYRIDADDIAFKIPAEDPENIFILGMEE